MTETRALPSYHCRRIPAGFDVDGDLAKPLWQTLPVIALKLADSAAEPLQTTRVRGAWDGEKLYLGFECEDEDIRASFTQRDDKVWLEEAVEAFIAPDPDLRHYYEFQSSPRNVVRDLQVSNPDGRPETATFDGAWDCPGWKTAVSRLTNPGDPSKPVIGWCAEWSIPLQAIQKPDAGPVQPGDRWRVNIFRIDRWPREEFSSWSAIPGHHFSFHRPNYFGHWIFE